MFRFLSRLLLCGSLLHPFFAAAQVLPDPDPERKRQAERIEVLRQQLEATPEVRLQTGEVEPLLRLPQTEMPCFPVQRIRIDGRWPQAGDLAPVLAGPGQLDSPLGRCLGAGGIELLVARLQNHLIAQGFVTARVEAPPQDLASGELVLTVLPGRVAQIRYADPAGPAPALAASVPTASGDYLNLRDIEQALENYTRVPSAETDIQIVPGEQAGTSDIVISRVDDRPLRGALSVDDSGTRSTGKYQATASLFYDNPLQLNDLFYLSLQHELGGKDPGERGSAGHVLHYSLPFGYWLIGLTDSESRYRQSVAGAERSYLYQGRSSTQEIAFTRVLQRSASGKTSGSLKAFSRRSASFIDDTEVEVQRRRTGGYEVALSHLQYLGGETLDTMLSFRRGTGAFGAISAPEEGFGEGTSRMQVLSASLGIQSVLPIDASFKLLYNTQLRGQLNGTALTPQDRFCIGGRYTVRGFDGERSLCGERGWLWRNDYLLALPDTSLQPYFSLDLGGVTGPSSQLLTGKTLVGAALGARAALGLLQVDLFVGTPLAKPMHFEAASMTFGFSINTRF